MKLFEFTHQQDLISLHTIKGSEEEYEDLLRWHTDENILEFYHGRDKNFVLEKLKSEYSQMMSEKDVYPCLIKLGDKNIGYLQFFKLQESGEYSYKNYHIDFVPDTYAFDLFIGEKEYWNKGIGSRLISKLAHYLIMNKDASSVFVDPRVENKRAVKAYEKAGFQKKKILKDHELFEGERRDCWLMEYIKDEQS